MQTEADDWNRKIEITIPKEFHSLFNRRDGATLFVQDLPKAFSPASVMTESDEQKAWELVGGLGSAPLLRTPG